ncbi:MAG: bifunctional ADP-dependent NAD(P)H-hydrate dehydratase/NAD(P)H-hydrate epimerase [Flavobacteriales bacterium]|nr:MAG: bifunctional ADP-dependent NAD(P)H-hydrate dehydratase/NAD(P)H-hydrate epimerase [Flavobacteriales bacterium]
MPKILSAKQLYEADAATIKNNDIEYIDLMEHVGVLCFNWIHSRLQGNPVVVRIFCGTGNNGGDGLVIARHLHQHGYHVKIYVLNCGNNRTDLFIKNYERLKEIGVWPEMITCTSGFPEVSENDMVIDAIFGLGLSRPPQDLLKVAIQFINNTNAFVLSVDFPSGLYADKPVTDKESVVKAYHTLTFQTPKLAFLLPDNKEFIQDWTVLDIGLDQNYIEKAKTDYYLMEREDVKSIYQPRNKFAHKGNFGHTLLIGGSKGKIGAMTLSVKAAVKVGSGLVSALIPDCGYNILQTTVPEAMAETNGADVITDFKYTSDASIIALGMGLGQDNLMQKGFVTFIKTNKKPLLIDADGLNILAKNKALLNKLTENTVLTPHPKEFERLVGKWKNDYDKLKKLLKFSAKYKLIVVLKGAYTAVAYDQGIYFNGIANPALATGGSGDVLSGIISGLMAQHYHPFSAALLGVYLHSSAADIAMRDESVETFVASDIIKYLPNAFKALLKKEKPKKEDREEEKTPKKRSIKSDDDKDENMYI